MNEPAPLDETARELIAAGREGVAPNEFVVERLRRSVGRALSGSAPPARSRSRTAPILAALAAAALGGVLYANDLGRSKEERAVIPKAAPPARVVPQSSSPAIPTAAPAASSEPSVLVPPAPAPGQTQTSGRVEPSAPSRSQQLGAEIELLARVNAAVNAGDGGRALELLGEYDRKFRPSILAEERAAALVLALCAKGRTSEARTAAEHFVRKWKHSPLLGRITRSCAGAE